MIKMQICSKCSQEKSFNQFDFRKDSNSYRKDCKECRKLRDKIYYSKNADKIKEKGRKYLKEKNKEINERRRFRRKLHPWKNVLSDIRHRCDNPKSTDYKYYGGRGIKCLISKEEIKDLWFRDGAGLLKRPSIDREDNDGNYEFDNCRFIEHIHNIQKAHNISIIQIDVNGKYLNTFSSLKDASVKLNISASYVSMLLNNKRTSKKLFFIKNNPLV